MAKRPRSQPSRAGRKAERERGERANLRGFVDPPRQRSVGATRARSNALPDADAPVLGDDAALPAARRRGSSLPAWAKLALVAVALLGAIWGLSEVRKGLGTERSRGTPSPGAEAP